VQGKKKLKNRNNNNYNPSIAPFFFVEWKKSKIHQTDERSDKIHYSPTRDPTELLARSPARKTKQNTNSDREKSALTLTRSPEGQQNSQVRCLKFQNLNFVLVLLLLPPELKKKERDTHTHTHTHKSHYLLQIQ
jgi:hypothetical protein